MGMDNNPKSLGKGHSSHRTLTQTLDNRQIQQTTLKCQYTQTYIHFFSSPFFLSKVFRLG